MLRRRELRAARRRFAGDASGAHASAADAITPIFAIIISLMIAFAIFFHAADFHYATLTFSLRYATIIDY